MILSLEIDAEKIILFFSLPGNSILNLVLLSGRHRAALAALTDGFLSPQGALTATMLPHLTALQGVIAIRTSTGRAPLYSALVPDFVERLNKLAGETSLIFPFDSIDTFYEQMQALIHFSTPALPARFQTRAEAPAVPAPPRQQKGGASCP